MEKIISVMPIAAACVIAAGFAFFTPHIFNFLGILFYGLFVSMVCFHIASLHEYRFIPVIVVVSLLFFSEMCSLAGFFGIVGLVYLAIDSLTTGV